METTTEPRKNRVSAFESEGARRGRQVSGRPSPEATAVRRGRKVGEGVRGPLRPKVWVPHTQGGERGWGPR